MASAWYKAAKPQGRVESCPLSGKQKPFFCCSQWGRVWQRRALGEGTRVSGDQGTMPEEGRFTFRPGALNFYRTPLPGDPSQCPYPRWARLTFEWHRNPR